MNETWREIAPKKSQQCLSGRQKERKEKKIDNGIINSKDKFNFIRRHPCRKSNWIKPPHRTPTNMSATVKLITKYMLRVRRLLFFIKKEWWQGDSPLLYVTGRGGQREEREGLKDFPKQCIWNSNPSAIQQQKTKNNLNKRGLLKD